ncbi:nucleolar protein 9 [Ammospiza maritima maritima]
MGVIDRKDTHGCRDAANETSRESPRFGVVPAPSPPRPNMVVHAEPPPEPDMSRQWRQSAPRLDPDTAEYFRRALETLEEGLSEEELALFTPNVLSELSRCLPSAALHPGGSRLLLRLLPRCPPETLTPFIARLGGVSRHPRGSRLLEAALGRALAALGRGTRWGRGCRGRWRSWAGSWGGIWGAWPGPQRQLRAQGPAGAAQRRRRPG